MATNACSEEPAGGGSSRSGGRGSPAAVAVGLVGDGVQNSLWGADGPSRPPLPPTPNLHAGQHWLRSAQRQAPQP